ncbi:FGGY-family carbohydrate kinase [Aurantiacibacter flavus]|uniref:Carbohydrate kinase n=1 Tax=Aurantiacibacter flavus TaxID=3145232 RepID=A0ABV0CYV7_9SPHN
MAEGYAVCIDVGKTLSKVTLWSRQGSLLDRQVRPNRAASIDSLIRLDASGIEAWLMDVLTSYAPHPVEFIVPVAHGAAAAVIEDDALAFPPIDYEQALPEDVCAAYQAERPAFAETGSPSLPNGLNLGAQLSWLQSLYPQAMESGTIVPWPQYWAWFLSGRCVSEVTSLGCHSDLWSPLPGHFSSMARLKGWDQRFAQLVEACEVVGQLRADIAAKTGLPNTTKILAGLHDSNAALMAARGFPQVSGKEATVLSTGTWFIAMRMARERIEMERLPEARDCLINVDAYSAPVPSARFMGGREIKTLIGESPGRIDDKAIQSALIAAVPQVLDEQAMVLPTLAPGCGPFPQGQSEWLNPPSEQNARLAAICLYAALVTTTSLRLIGSIDCLLVEGRFADSEVFVRALASLRPDLQIFVADGETDVSFGALRLIDPELVPAAALQPVEPLDHDLSAYAEKWHSHVEAFT